MKAEIELASFRRLPEEGGPEGNGFTAAEEGRVRKGAIGVLSRRREGGQMDGGRARAAESEDVRVVVDDENAEGGLSSGRMGQGQR